MFLLNIKDNYSPVGYVNVPGPVVTIQWTERGQILACTSDGYMCLIDKPSLDNVDTSQSYHLNTINVTSMQFNSIKDRLRVRDIYMYTVCIVNSYVNGFHIYIYVCV